MKKRILSLLFALCLVASMTACGDKKKDNKDTKPVTEQQEEPVVDTPATVEPSGEENPTVEDTPATEAGWAPVFTSPTGDMDDAAIYAAELAMVEKGKKLFSGETNAGYYSNDEMKLADLEAGSSFALIYACDDATHGGWGVLGFGMSAAGNWVQLEVKAYTEEPTKERIAIYPVSDFVDLAGTKVEDITGFCLGAWNGGRIAGLYILDAAATTQLTDYMSATDKASLIQHSYTGELSNPNATEATKVVYEYLKENYGKYCITGQMESTWKGSPDYEMNYIYDASGRYPAIRGLDFMNKDYQGVVNRAVDWWNKGGIVTICWHTGADYNSGYNECKADNINWDDAFTVGTDTYNNILAGLDRIAPYLQQLEDAGVPVLWRPYHELDGGWFWWSKGGSENFVKLWQLTYERLTEYWGLDNLIWVYGYSQSGTDMASWYPGDEYIDLIGADSYTAGANKELFEQVKTVAPTGMPIVFHENGTIPTAEQMLTEGAPWSYFMTWHTEWITDTKYNTTDSIHQIFNGDYFITLDELPSFLTE